MVAYSSELCCGVWLPPQAGNPQLRAPGGVQPPPRGGFQGVGPRDQSQGCGPEAVWERSPPTYHVRSGDVWSPGPRQIWRRMVPKGCCLYLGF